MCCSFYISTTHNKYVSLFCLRRIAIWIRLWDSDLQKYVVFHIRFQSSPIRVLRKFKPTNISMFPPMTASPVLAPGIFVLPPLPTNLQNLSTFNTNLKGIIAYSRSCYNKLASLEGNSPFY